MPQSPRHLPIVADLPLDKRSDAEILAAIEEEMKGLKLAQAAIEDAAAAAISGSEAAHPNNRTEHAQESTPDQL